MILNRMNNILIYVLAFIVIGLFFNHANANEVAILNQTEEKDISKIFDKYNVDGTLVLSSLNGTEYAYNINRSKTNYLPASTFKIVNTLIALNENAIKNENEILKWDQKDKGYAEWNKDQTLNTAFRSSCIWFYQELAKRIGNKQYLHYLKRLDYGNNKTGDNIETFWLDGDLRISAQEQILVLKNIYSQHYSFKKEHYATLKNIMKDENSSDYELYAKTGFVTSTNPQIGWYVGYIITAKHTWFFALNMDIKTQKDLPLRKTIVIEALKEKGII